MVKQFLHLIFRKEFKISWSKAESKFVETEENILLRKIRRFLDRKIRLGVYH